MKLCKLLLTIISICCCTNILAAIYYVDAKNGNDSWSGKTSSISAPDGPWQSIAKVNAASFQPGDQILFSCGQTWYEPLKPKTSGTASAQIYFRSYPLQCTNKPKISGFRPVAFDNWQPYKGNIWKATFPQNLIINGSVSKTVAYWTKWPSDASQTFNSTCPLSVTGCMNFLAGTSTNMSVAISRTFLIVGGKKYSTKVSVYVPTGSWAKIIVREHSSPYRTLGLAKTLTGNDSWQHVNVELTSPQTVTNARLDIEVPKNKQIYVRNAIVQETGSLTSPSMVLFNGDPLTIAHHPNAGHDSANPNSVYLRTSAASPIVADSNNRKVNSQIFTPNLELPSGGSIGVGTKLRIRTVNWRIDDFAVSNVGSGSLSITPNTLYPISAAGWGFYFYDELWMLDSAGEWYFDENTQTLYLWSPTNTNPGNSVTLATNLGTAIIVSSKSNLMVENLEIDGAVTGVDMQLSSNITLQSLYIHNTKSNAIFARQSANANILSNRINRVSVSGVAAINAYLSTNALIENNLLSEAGLIVKAGKRVSLPMTSDFTIFGGTGSTIANNSLSYTGGIGIYSDQNSNIDSNVLENSCFNINDCSAIYVSPKSLETVIQNNLVLDVTEDMTGTPNSMWRISNGIYLDNGVAKISVLGNSVRGGVASLHLHNSKDNTINGNLLYGAKAWLINQQEDSLANGGITGNVINDNQLVPSVSNEAIHNSFLSSDASKFATYDKNQYSTIFSPYIVKEFAANGSSDAHTLEDWQKAKTSTGVLRNNDLNGSTPAPLPSFAQGTVVGKYVFTTDFSAGFNGWSSWNETAPKSSQVLEGCLPVSAKCMHVTSGASETLVNSPKFTVTKGQFYRVSFDLKTTATNANLTSVVRFAGPNNYKQLMKTINKFTGSTKWQRYSFIFDATESANSLTVADQGARFDIQGLTAKQDLWVANLEILPYNPGYLGPTRTDLLVNKTDTVKSVDCPTSSSNPALCASYFMFPEATKASWPVSVPPRSGRVAFTQNISLLDTDNDGIADSQDTCAGTAKALAVNARGCSLLD
jgi:hypothetical protein